MQGFARIALQAAAITVATLVLAGQAGRIIIVGPAGVMPDIPADVASAAGTSNIEHFPIVNTDFASDQPFDGPIASLVKQLRSESYLERENASSTLLRLPPDRLHDVVAALSIETDAEAIARLKVAAGHLYLKPRTPVKAGTNFLGIGAVGQSIAMLGLKFDLPERMRLPGTHEEIVVVPVRELQPGFPAAQELLPGDRITAIAGEPFSEEMAPVKLPTEGLEGSDLMIAQDTNSQRETATGLLFQHRIRALWPGSVVAFTVLRDGKLRDVPVQLAAIPAASADNLSIMVEMRNQLMADFVDTLKTGEQLQASGPTLGAGIAAAGHDVPR